MPIIHYFVFVGGLLLALLFAGIGTCPLPSKLPPRRIPTEPPSGSVRREAFRRRSCSTRVRVPTCRRSRRRIPSLKNRRSRFAKPWPQCLQHLRPRSRKSRPLASPRGPVRVRSARPSFREEHPSDGLPSTGTTHLPADGGERNSRSVPPQNGRASEARPSLCSWTDLTSDMTMPPDRIRPNRRRQAHGAVVAIP